MPGTECPKCYSLYYDYGNTECPVCAVCKPVENVPMNERDELELSEQQHKAIIAVDVIRLCHSGDPETKVLYRRAVKTLERYLEPVVPDGELPEEE